MTALNDVVVGDDDRGAQLERVVINENGNGWVKAGTAADAECETTLSDKKMWFIDETMAVYRCEVTFVKRGKKLKHGSHLFLAGKKHPKSYFNTHPPVNTIMGYQY